MLFYRFRVNILPRGLIPHGYTILCPQHHLERTYVCMYVFYLPSIIKLWVHIYKFAKSRKDK